MSKMFIYQKDSTLVSHQLDDVERVDPREFIKNVYVDSAITKLKAILEIEHPEWFIPGYEKETLALIMKQVAPLWNELYNDIQGQPLPSNLLQLIKADRKRDQEKLLKGQTLTLNVLLKLYIVAFEQFGFTFSQYRGEKFHKEVNKDDLPLFIHLKDDNLVEKIGDTPLTDGQLKNVVSYRKVVIARFLDHPDGSWHCFINTYAAMSGKESAHPQAHFHYLSDKFGFSREAVVNQIKAGEYPTTSVHIDILDAGYQVP